MLRKISSLIIAICIIITIIPVQNIDAKVTISAPKKLKVREGIYYDWVNAHKDELDFMPGDISSAKISWSKVKGADGYKVQIIWRGGDGGYTDTVNITKHNKSYIMKTSKYTTICKKIMGEQKNKMKTSKLSFCLFGGGSDFCLDKVIVKSYKKVNGKKIWSKNKVKLFNQW